MRKRGLVITIDGPAASGKTSTARRVAERLGYRHLDTGAMYRAVALKTLRAGWDPDCPEDLERLRCYLDQMRLEVRMVRGEARIILEGEDVTASLRSPEATARASLVARIPEVRQCLVAHQRSWGEEGGVVVEGRDIGTVVFRDAELKVFLVASLEERARRRLRELAAHGVASAEALEEQRLLLEERDRTDTSREIHPLRPAADALVLDTTELSVDQQVERVVVEVEKRLEEQGPGRPDQDEGS